MFCNLDDAVPFFAFSQHKVVRFFLFCCSERVSLYRPIPFVHSTHWSLLLKWWIDKKNSGLFSFWSEVRFQAATKHNRNIIQKHGIFHQLYPLFFYTFSPPLILTQCVYACVVAFFFPFSVWSLILVSLAWRGYVSSGNEPPFFTPPIQSLSVLLYSIATRKKKGKKKFQFIRRRTTSGPLLLVTRCCLAYQKRDRIQHYRFMLQLNVHPDGPVCVH